jgi:hypothetical protein
MSIKWFELRPEEREEAAKKLAEALRREERVAVYLSGEVDLLDVAAYAEELSSRLAALVGLPVDVVVLNFAPTWLRRRAFSGRELVVKDELLYAALWANALDEELGLTAHSR